MYDKSKISAKSERQIPSMQLALFTSISDDAVVPRSLLVCRESDIPPKNAEVSDPACAPRLAWVRHLPEKR